MLADRVKMSYIDKDENLINNNNKLFRLNNGSIILGDNSCQVVSTGSELAGFIIPVDEGVAYQFIYDYTGTPSSSRILTYTSYPTSILNYTEDTITSFNSGLVWLCPPNVTHIVVGAYASSISNFTNMAVRTVQYFYKNYPEGSTVVTGEYLANFSNNTIDYNFTNYSGIFASGTLSRGSSIQILNETSEKYKLYFSLNGDVTADYRSPYFGTYYPFILTIS